MLYLCVKKLFLGGRRLWATIAQRQPESHHTKKGAISLNDEGGRFTWDTREGTCPFQQVPVAGNQHSDLQGMAHRTDLGLNKGRTVSLGTELGGTL